MTFSVSGAGAVYVKPSPTPVPAWGQPLEDGYPAVIDRFNDPGAYPDYVFEEDAELLEIIFPNVRDCDCTVIRAGGEVWMIDCADKGVMAGRVIETLKKFSIESIDTLIITHPHHDHLNGLREISDAVPVGRMLICFPEDSTQHIISAAALCAERGIPIEQYTHGDTFTIGNAAVEVWRQFEEKWSINNQSAVYRLTYGERSMLFLADAEDKEQRLLAESAEPAWLDCDIMRYPHHGKTAMVEKLYTAIDPFFVTVTNHARGGEAWYYLGCKHVPTAYTVSAYVKLTTDGKHWIAEQVK
ncbi:MAG: MBL fold metallo-hydrolase [Clostridia bacterium]|nr:MBL fold metallo-hydrolase [Clostridia bacterium]